MTHPLGLHRSNELVAFGPQGDRHAGDLLGDAAAIASTLPNADPGAQLLLVIEQDRYFLAAAMLAAWSRGYTVAFPPHGRRAGVAFVLTQPAIRLLIHDTAAGGHLQVSTLLTHRTDPLPAAAWPRGEAVRWYALAASGQGVESWGQTGAQLEAEVDALHRQLPVLHSARVTATLEPFGPAAIVLGILVPLLCGGAFHRSPLGEALALEPGGIWVTTPYDARGAQLSQRPWDTVLWATRDATAWVGRRTTMKRPVQALLLGPSSGSVAMRSSLDGSFNASGESWQPLHGVTCYADAEGVLGVDAPWKPADGRAPACRVIPVKAGFHVEGRPGDPTVVPAEGIRLSCAALEAWLLEQPGVDDACVAACAETEGLEVFALFSGRADPETLAEALDGVVKTEIGQQKRCTVDLRQVSVLPREPEGELPAWRLLRHFDRDPEGRPRATTLAFSSPERLQQGSQELASVTIDVPADFRWFVGHFDGYPILAGVVQLHEIVLPFIRAQWPQLGPLRELQKLKFLGRIVPGDEVRLTVTFEPSTLACDFSLDKTGQPCSAGRLCFTGKAP